MKSNKIKLLVLGSIVTVSMIGFTGCKSFDKPELIEITPSQTAILLPLEGEISNQSKLGSEEFLQKNLVSSKRIEIPHKWLKEGRGIIFENGKYIPTHKLIVVERKPETREWTADDKSGSNAKNDGIKAETKESIALTSNMNCTAQIDEDKAVKFLYRYNGATLASIMDTEIRSRITTKFVELCSQYTLSELLVNKAKVMEEVRNDAIPYFAERGITITALGIAGDFTYNPEIQKSIDEKFKSEKSLETQKAENEKVVSKAKADAEALEIQAKNLDKQIQLKQIEAQFEWIKKWDGKVPQYQGVENSMIQLPNGK